MKKKIFFCESYLIHLKIVCKNNVFFPNFCFEPTGKLKKKYSQHPFSVRFIVNNLPLPFYLSFLRRYVWKDIHEKKKTT